MSYNITIELLGCNSNTGTIQVLSCTSTSAENSEGSPYNYVFRSETGSFYPYYSNPLGYLTSAVANSGGVLSINSISGNLILTGAGSVSITTGIDGYIYISGSAIGNSVNISGLISTGDADLRYYPLLTNPSGYINSGETGQFFPSYNTGIFYPIYNPNNYINSGNTGNLIGRWESGNFYSIENTNNYSTSGNLAASGADLLNRQQLLSGNLINSGILLYNSDSIISGKLISLSGDLITYINNDNQTGNLVGRWETGQFYSIDNINNYANSGDLGRYAILTGDNSFSGSNTFTTSIQITNNAAVGGTLILHAPDGSTATPNHSKIRAGFISAQRTLTTPDKNGLIAVISDLSGYYLSGNGELLSGNLITTGFNLNNKIISLSGDLGSTGQNLNNQLRAIQSSGITGISITGGSSITGLLNITGNYGVQTIQIGNTIHISGLINKWTGFCGDGTSTGIVLNINLNDNNICWSLRETGNNKEFVYPTSYISGNSLVLKFSSGWAPTLNQYIFTAIG